MRRFSHEGVCLFGEHRGVHATLLPHGWVHWARSNISGFSEALETALATPPPAPKSRPTGRRYVLRSHFPHR